MRPCNRLHPTPNLTRIRLGTMVKRTRRAFRLRHEEQERIKREDLARELRKIAGADDAELEANLKPGVEEFNDDDGLPSSRFTIMRPLSDDVDLPDIISQPDLRITSIERRIIERPAEATRVEIDLEVMNSNPLAFFRALPDRMDGRDRYVFKYEGTVYLVLDIAAGFAAVDDIYISDARIMEQTVVDSYAQLQIRGEAQITEDQVVLPPHLRGR